MGSEKSYRLVRFRRHMTWRRYCKMLAVLAVVTWGVQYLVKPSSEIGSWAFYVWLVLAVALGLMLLAGIVVYARTRAPLPPKWQKKRTG